MAKKFLAVGPRVSGPSYLIVSLRYVRTTTGWPTSSIKCRVLQGSGINSQSTIWRSGTNQGKINLTQAHLVKLRLTSSHSLRCQAKGMVEQVKEDAQDEEKLTKSQIALVTRAQAEAIVEQMKEYAQKLEGSTE